MIAKTRTKEESLIVFANRLSRLIRFKLMGSPVGVIKKQIELIIDLVKSGEIRPVNDRDLVHKAILAAIAQDIASDQIDRFGGYGNSCGHCALLRSCDRDFEDTTDDFSAIFACEEFVKSIEPSKRPFYESVLERMDGCFGVKKDLDIREVNILADALIIKHKERSGLK